MPDIPIVHHLALHKADDKKHSVVYKPNPSVANSPLSSVYIARSAFPKGMPQVVYLSISDAPIYKES